MMQGGLGGVSGILLPARACAEAHPSVLPPVCPLLGPPALKCTVSLPAQLEKELGSPS